MVGTNGCASDDLGQKYRGFPLPPKDD